ncbi:MAG: transglycosylase SLT domain-containing protein [Gemmatimonadaceae bacterium]
MTLPAIRTYKLLVLAATIAACRASSPPAVPTAAPVATPQADAGSRDGSPSRAPVSDSSKLARVVASDSAPADDTIEVASHEVTREAIAIFGDSVATIDSVPDSADHAPPPDSLDEEPAAPAPTTWDIDVRSYETHRRVAYYMERFTGSAKDRFGMQITRGSQYEPMIRAKLRKAGLPEDLTYLALIESGYDAHAYSRAAAVGIWQFMTATAKGVGLRVDWWIDERRDPVRSTDGAIKYLGWLNDRFGSLYLAAAAYNGGAGRVGRGLRRYAGALRETTGDDAFFALAEKDYLRAETRDYVPKLIAAALVAKEPQRYGIDIDPLPPFAHDSICVGASTPLLAVAKASGATLAEIRHLNPQVLRGVTPPHDSVLLRLPAGKADGFRDSYAELPAEDRAAYSRITTRKNESLAALAGRARVSAKTLGWYNRGLKRTKRGRLIGGQVVLVPSPDVVAAALDVPDPAIERYGRSSGRTSTHVVRRGESLSSIAKKYRTNVATLKRLNGLRKTVIHPGQVILVKRTVASKGKKATVKRGTSRTARTAKTRD